MVRLNPRAERALGLRERLARGEAVHELAVACVLPVHVVSHRAALPHQSEAPVE